MITKKYIAICLLILVLAQVTGSMIVRADSSRLSPQVKGSPGGELPSRTFAAGRILVQFRSEFPQTSTASLLSSYGAVPQQEIVPGTYTVSVSRGQEEALVEQLRKDPAVESAMLDLRLEGPPLQTLTAPTGEAEGPWPGPNLNQTPSGVITETLHMSVTPAGPPLPENTLPTESPQVHAVFDHEGLEQDPVRVQVYWLDTDSSPIVAFDTVQNLDGSGTASVVVPASDYFVDLGTFPIGRYLTLVHVSVSGSWKAVATVSWHVSTQPNDRWFLSDQYQWNLHNSGNVGTLDADIDAPEAWDVTTGSDKVTIALLSSGIAIDHPDLRNKIWVNENEVPGNGVDDDGNGYVDDVNGFEFFQEDDNANPADDIGWGTFAAGIAAAETNNQFGMAGVSWGARLMPVKVMRLYVTDSARVPYGFVSDVIQGLHYAADNGARVIFLALTVSSAEFEQVELLRQAVEYATDRGSLVIGVVGDAGRDDAVWPALFPQVLAVGATDSEDELAKFSNFGEALEDGIVAPGELILSTCTPNLPACIGTIGNYPVDPHGQTAWAAAQVAGVASLVLSVNPGLSPDELRTRLLETADDLGPPGADQLYGHGRLNAGRAVRWTRHMLQLSVPELFFLVDDQDTEVCRVIQNVTTGPFSWSASDDADWLRVNGPTAFTPSELQVCVDRFVLGDYDTYTATLTILSTIDTQTEPMSLPVTAKYIPHKSRVFVPLLTREGVDGR